MKLWLFISGILAWVGMCLSALTPHAHAWSGERGLAMHRGLVAHTLFNKGMSGRQDNVGKQPWSSFSYPQGRSLLVYSGGAERDWNSRSNTGGEGVWVLPKLLVGEAHGIVRLGVIRLDGDGLLAGDDGLLVPAC